MSIAIGSRQRRVKRHAEHFAADTPPPFAVRQFTVDEYHRLIDAGFFAENERLELLDGWIVPKMTRKPPHDVCVDLLREILGGLLPAGWRPRIQSAITLSTSELEPDCAIVRGSARDYVERHPTPEDIALVIEVADSSADRDRFKAAVYARDRVPRYWLVNLVDRVIEVHSQPTGRGAAARYKSVKLIQPGGRLTLKLGSRSFEIAADDVLP